MGVHSGKFGLVSGPSGATTVRNWSISPKTSPRPVVASNTYGGTTRVQGVADWSGSFSSYGDVPVVMPGAGFSFAGYTAPNDDGAGDNGATYSGPAIVQSIEVNWDWKTGEPITNMVEFAANGALSVADSAPTLDISELQLFSPLMGGIIVPKMQLVTSAGPQASLAALPNVVSAKLKITAANKEYVNSSTAGNTFRKMGPIDWSLSLTVEDDDPTNVDSTAGQIALALNSYYSFQLYTAEAAASLTRYWKLNWGILESFSDIRVDRESGEIIRHTQEYKMAGYIPGYYSMSANVPGGIWYPASTSNTQWWPFAA